MTLQEKLDLLKDLLVLGRITDAEYDIARLSVMDGETTAEVLARFSRPPGGPGDRKKPE